MATFYIPNSSGWTAGGTYVRYRIEIIEGALSGRTRALTVRVVYWRTNSGYTTKGNGSCYCTINGTKYGAAFTSAKTITYNSMTVLFSKTVNVTYDSAGKATVTAAAYSNSDNTNIASSSHSGSTSLTSIGPATYTVTYKVNASDAYGAPSSQTKKYGVALTLSSHKPARPGYTFVNWNTASGGTGTKYLSGASYTANANVTLYAQWKKNTYTVSYNANGGSGAPSSQTKTHGVNMTLSSTKPSLPDYTFKGWSTSASSKTVAYAPGGAYTSNASITLYAVWELAYALPRISITDLYRCDEAGNNVNNGTYFRIIFDWDADLDATAIDLRWRAYKSSSWLAHNANNLINGDSGTVDLILGNDSISLFHSYDIEIVVTDSKGSMTMVKSLSSKVVPLDVLNGAGIAFGKYAEEVGYFDVAWDARFDGSLSIGGVDSKLLAYPVNSIYISYDHVSPAEKFGGSWERISPYFLYATGETGDIGGTGYVSVPASSGSNLASYIKVSAWRRIE